MRLFARIKRVERDAADHGAFSKTEWVDAFYKECGREITLSMSTLHTLNYWTVFVVVALIPVLAAIGSYPNALSFSILASALVVVMRFYVRSLVAYAYLSRFNVLQGEALAYLQSGDQARLEKLALSIEQLITRQRLPMSRLQLLWENAKLSGFAYLFPILLAATTWTALQLRSFWQAQLLSVVWVALMIGEVLLFLQSRQFVHTPNDQESGTKFPRNASTVIFWVVFVGALCVVITAHWDDVATRLADSWGSEPNLLPD